MPAKGRYKIFLFNAAAALISAVATVIILRATMTDSSALWQKEVRPTIAPAPVTQPEQTALLRPEPPESETPTAQSPDANGEEPPNPKEVEAWSTAVQAPDVTTQPDWTTKLTPSRRAQKQYKSIRKRRHTSALKARLAEISPKAIERLQKKFSAAKVAWPPSAMALVAIKDERALELYAREADGAWQHVHRYPVLAASGGAGPKLQQGDRQVPEGVYRISYLNPKSAYHVSLRVNYPNRFDRKMARKDGRRKLGGDIMIHGKRSSAGCLAMGDDAAEELFVLAAQTGYSKVKLIIAPTDFRKKYRKANIKDAPEWLPKLYSEVATAMTDFKAPPPKKSTGLLSLFMQ